MRHFLPLMILALAACDPKADADDAPLPDDTNTDTDTDTDQDGSPDAVDCAPNDPAIHPGAEESCNGLDDNCDGNIDEETRRWYRDGDGDGHGDATGTAVWGACDVPPPDHVDDSTDCDDTNPDINPSATEVCDPLDVDEDCDGRSDDDDDSATGKLDYFEDGDGDGYGSEQAEPEAWCDPPPDRVPDATDCDDEDATTHPGASEAEIGLLEDAACEGVAGGNLTRADLIFVGEQDGDTLGTSLRSAGDVDGDGLDDILIGARNNDDVDHGAGKTYLILGSTLVTASSSPFDLMDSDYIFLGEQGGDWSGSAVSSAGDVDGDGLDDILVGAMWNDDNGDNCGKVHVILGSSLASSSTSTIDLAASDYALLGEHSSDQAGARLGSAGDVDGDGLDDILIGAMGNDDNGDASGKAYLVMGSSLAASPSSSIELADADFSFIGEAALDRLGYDLSSAGDVDDDGLDDIILGAPWNNDNGYDAGKVYLFLGRTLAASTLSTLPLSDADLALDGEDNGDEAGISISAAGDVDGDGLDDILIGAHDSNDLYTSIGRSYLVLGSTLSAGGSTSMDLGFSDFIFIGENRYDGSGERVSAAGDVDGDGLDDLLIASFRGYDGGHNAGKVHLVLGGSLTDSPRDIRLGTDDIVFGGEEDGWAGYDLSTAGDIDGDGLSDILIGSPQLNAGPGRAYLVRGY